MLLGVHMPPPPPLLLLLLLGVTVPAQTRW
jgi:hypothetical protein